MLPEHDWDVTVLTARTGDASALDRESENEIAKHAEIVRAWSPVSKLVKRGAAVPKRGVAGLARKLLRKASASIAFPDREVFWVPGAIEAGRRALRERPHHLVFATYGPASNLLVGRALARAFSLPLIVDFRDLWSTLPMPVFATELHRAAALRIEREIVRKASRITAVAPAMAQDLAATHEIDPSRAISITNGFDPSDVLRVHDARSGGPFRLMYCGTVHVHYDLEPFWRALRALADAGVVTPASFRVEFVGSLSTYEPKSHGVMDFIDISPLVPHAEVFGALARADALLMVETPGYYARYGYAAKVFDYVLTGKPVVALVDPGGNSDRLLRAAEVGHCVATNDSKGVEATLRRLIEQARPMPRRVDPDASPLREFNRKHLVAKLAAVFDEVVSAEPKGRW